MILGLDSYRPVLDSYCPVVMLSPGGIMETDFNVAVAFATESHGEQKRKYSGEPYVVHCIEVADMVWAATSNNAWRIAAVLHDTVEDTQVKAEDIAAKFGDEVATLVLECSDVSRPEDGNRAARKAKDLAHTASASVGGKTIKLADLISNTRSIIDHDKNFSKVYLPEMAKVFAVLGEGNSELRSLAKEILDAACARLDAETKVRYLLKKAK
jgi:(p)ppGpp synthase/HD superfamily hydrolase